MKNIFRLALAGLRKQLHGNVFCILPLLCGLFSAMPTFAAVGNFANSGGVNTYAQSLWWLDFSGYSDAAAASGQPFFFSLPNNAGTLNLSVRRTAGGTNALNAVALPTWTGGGAFGNGAYNGILGSPSLYWNGLGTGTTLALSFNSLVMRDGGNNPRSFSFAAADGEKMDTTGESLTYTSTAPWRLTQSVVGYPGYNGGPAQISGAGSNTVVENGPTVDNGFNGSIILETQTPSQVSVSYTGISAALFALSVPPVTLNIVVAGRVNAADQFTSRIGYTTPYYNIRSASTSGALTTATTGATLVLGTNSITLDAVMAAGSVSPLASYTGSMACANSGPGSTGYGVPATVLPTGAGTSFAMTPKTGDAIACTLTLTPQPQPVSGRVYLDENANGSIDGAESGTNVAGLFVKLAPSTGSVCSGPATQAAAVNTVTGAYSTTNLPQGNYCLILDNNSTLSDITPSVPAGYIATENPSGIDQIAVGGAPVPPQNFGFYSGSQLSGVVFLDTGIGTGGIANNGLRDGSEAGIGGVLVDVRNGLTVVATATTAGTGSDTIFVPGPVGSRVVTPVLPSGYLATGGTPGDTGGSYTRPDLTYTTVNGTRRSSADFAFIPPNSFIANGAQSTAQGSVVFYTHTYTPGSAGSVSFALSAVATPVISGWTQVLFRDSNCNAFFDAGEPQITTAIAVTAGAPVCLIVRQQAPSGAPLGAQNTVTVSATMVYANYTPPPIPPVRAVTDTTIIASSGGIVLSKLVRNITVNGPGVGTTAINAAPGQTMEYTVTATNNGSQPVSTIVINDATPSFTNFVSAACPLPATFPAGITACTVSIQPAAGASGAVQWMLTGSLTPTAQVAVRFQIKVDQ